MKIANLATLRGRSGMTQAQLARASGVSRDTISNLETESRTEAREVTANKLALGLGVGVSEFVSRAQEAEGPGAVGRALSNPAGRYFSRGGSTAPHEDRSKSTALARNRTDNKRMQRWMWPGHLSAELYPSLRRPRFRYVFAEPQACVLL